MLILLTGASTGKMPFYWLVRLGTTTGEFQESAVAPQVSQRGRERELAVLGRAAPAMECFKSKRPNITKVFSQVLLWSTGVLQRLGDLQLCLSVCLCTHTCVGPLWEDALRKYFSKQNERFYQKPVLLQIEPLALFVLCEGFNLLPV